MRDNGEVALPFSFGVIRLLGQFVIRVNLPSYALQPRNDTAVGGHCGRIDQGPEMDRVGGVDWSSGRRWATAGEGR